MKIFTSEIGHVWNLLQNNLGDEETVLGGAPTRIIHSYYAPGPYQEDAHRMSMKSASINT